MQKVRPFLWYDGQAEEAATFYTSLFADAEILERSPAGSGTVQSVTFRLAGQEYIAFNGGPHFTFTPAFSLFVTCDTQDEIDEYWAKLVAGGKPSRCGWLVDRFGVSWQIVPRDLGDLLQDPDRERAGRAFQAMMGMVKLDIAALRRAADGR